MYNKELFEDYYFEAEKFLKDMSLEQKVGQMFFPRFNKSVRETEIKKYYPGGFVLFGYDFEESDAEILDNIRIINELSKNATNLPLGLAVDEEGGKVNRVSKYKRKEPFPSPLNEYKEHGLDGIKKIEEEKRNLLRKYKLNINLAPVADFSKDPKDYIYPRTLGQDINKTRIYIGSEVEWYNADNFSCCAKHFPGYGNNVDTHGQIGIDNRTYETFLKEDFLPFKAGITSKIPMIMVNHNIVKCKEPRFPSTLSKNWHNILRKDLNFSGLILTDSLTMNGIIKFNDTVPPAVRAVNAGNDILLTSNFSGMYGDVIKAAKEGDIKEETINFAVRRIIAWKCKYLGVKYENKTNNKLNFVE